MLWKGFPDEGFLPRELKEAGLIRKEVREEHCRQRGTACERLLTGQFSGCGASGRGLCVHRGVKGRDRVEPGRRAASVRGRF